MGLRFCPGEDPAFELSAVPWEWRHNLDARGWAPQVREFKPQLVAIKGDRVAELRELLRGAPVMPEIVVGDSGIVEVASHRDADSVVTGASFSIFIFFLFLFFTSDRRSPSALTQ